MGRCCSAIDALAIQYVREIAVVLRTKDLDRIKAFYRDWQSVMDMDPMPDDAQLEIDMHKMIIELPALEDMHEESLEWLKAHDEAWDVRGNNCSHGCDPGGCGRKAVGDGPAGEHNDDDHHHAPEPETNHFEPVSIAGYDPETGEWYGL
jgi:hypothetical protein